MCLCRQVTGSAYDPELLLEQEPLTGGASCPPSPPRASLDVPLSLQRAHTEREAALPDARQGDCKMCTQRYPLPVPRPLSPSNLPCPSLCLATLGGSRINMVFSDVTYAIWCFSLPWPHTGTML